MRKFIPVAAIAATGLAITAIPALGATKTLSVKDNLFAPGTVTVKKGTTVKWVWRGVNPHTVTVKSGPAKFTTGVKTSGSFQRKLTKAGTYKIICKIHPGMHLTLRVK